MNKDFIFQMPTKQEYIHAYSTWFDSLSKSHVKFATTVVFHSSGCKPRPDFFSSQYEHKFLWKINKQISRRASKLLFYYDFYRYEFGESSRFRSVTDKRSPHHIHGMILIPKEHVHNIWDNENNKISGRLQKDFNSIKNVSSILVEPIIEGKILTWISYISKRKDFYQDQ